MAQILFNRMHYCTSSLGVVQGNISGIPQNWAICSTDPLVSTGDCLTWQVVDVGDIFVMGVGFVLDPNIDLPFESPPVWTTTDALWSFGVRLAPPPQREYFDHPIGTETEYVLTDVFKILRTDTGLEYYVNDVLVDTRAAGSVDLPGPPMPPLYPAFTGAFQTNVTPPTIRYTGATNVGSCGSSAVASWPLPPLNWTAVGIVTGPPVFEGTTQRFAAGNGSEYYLVAQLTDSGNELRSKVVKSVRQTGKRTNVEAMIFGYDVGDPIVVSDLEDGIRANVKMTTRPQAMDDSTQVSQSKRKQINVKNAVLSTVRIAGDDRGQTERDRIDEVVLEAAIEGVRR